MIFLKICPKRPLDCKIKCNKCGFEKDMRVSGDHRFFSLTLNHESLVSLYRNNFALMHHHKYSLTELENMIPWEREIYLTLLMDYIKEENAKQ